MTRVEKMIDHPAEKHQVNTVPGRARVLIVDDAPDILASLKDILEMEIEDCIVELATDVEQAKFLAQQAKFDIALLDIKLGQDSGLDLIPVLKKINPDIACVMMTAYRDNKYTVKAVRFGANDYLYKPIAPVKLIQTIERLLHQQQIKHQLIKAERRFRAVFEQATQWLFLIDNTGRLLEANETALAFVGQTKSAVVGEILWNTPWWRSSPKAQDRLQSGLVETITGHLFHQEMDVGETEQSRQIYDVTMKPVFEGKNEIGQIIVECRNITAGKAAEKEIKTLNATLEQRVTERTLALEQSILLLEKENENRRKVEYSLIKTKEVAEQASRAKSDFLSRMSHELRTPLNAILGFGQLLETDHEQPLTDLQADSMREIMHAGDHLLTMVNEVLDLSRIESGRLSIKLEPVAIVPLLEACVSQIKPLATQHGINITLELSIASEVQGDHVRLKEVLLNLLSNAVKYNREGGEIRLYCAPAGPKRLRISVQDTGRGIPAEAFSSLFIPFERLVSAYEAIDGTGIGLALAKRLVEAMHGEIGVESVLGEGSTFWFELPLA